MKKLFKISLFIFSALVLFAISGCTSSTLPTPTGESTQIPSATLPPTLTPTPSPTLTPTPVPVTIQEAIQRGTFAELEVFNKGDIYHGVSSGPLRDEIIHLSTFSPNGQQFVAVTKRGLYAYDVESWQELVSVPLSPEVSITSIGYSVDSSLFAAGDSSGAITFWNMQTWKIQNSFQVHKGAVTSLDISPDNMNFVTIGDQKEISLWNMSDGSLIKSQLRSKRAGPAYYSLDGKWLYISEAGGGSDLIIWNSKDLTLTNRLGQLGRRPPEQAVSPYTNTAAAYGFDTITLYDFDKQETSEVKLDKRYTTPTQMTFLDEKTLLMKFLRSDDYYLVDLESHAFTTLSLEALSKKTFKNPEFLHLLKSKEIKALGFGELGYIQNITPDGTALIISGQHEIPSGVFDLSKKAMDTSNQEFPWDSSVFLSDGSLAGVDWVRSQSDKKQQGDFTITILDASFSVKSKIKQPYDLPYYIFRAKVSPSEKFLAAGTGDGNLYLWNLDTKELIAKTKPHGDFALLHLFFNKDDSYMVVSAGAKIKVISMEDFSEVISVNGTNPVFSPDGSHLAYAGLDNNIRLISLLNEDMPKVFRGIANEVWSIAFSPDRALLFSGDYGGEQSNLKVWSISDETLLLDLPQYNPLISLIVSPDGTHLYLQETDRVMSVWGHDPEK